MRSFRVLQLILALPTLLGILEIGAPQVATHASATRGAPTPRAVFAAAAQAMGGARALRRIRSIAATADCTGPKGAYKTEIHSMRGGLPEIHTILDGS